MLPQRLTGVLSPVVTPFRADLSVDADRLVAHCRWLLSHDVGLAVFGTNSEGNSLTVPEKIDLLDTLVGAGLPAARMMPGTGACALGDTVALTRKAVEFGCGGVLMLPPFYYKGVPDEGLYRFCAEVIQRVGDERLRIYLYHIPPVAHVGYPMPLVERLVRDFPQVIAGMKDSSGDWNHTRSMIETFAPAGFDVFCGSENFLLATLRAGGTGCISATTNVNPGPIARLYTHWRDEDADARQSALDAVRAAFQKHPMIAAMKAALAHFRADADWQRLRPPLIELDPAAREALLATLAAIGFSID